jgi:hypothetical protein
MQKEYINVFDGDYICGVSFSFATLQACSKDGRSTIQIIDLIIMVVVLF